MKAMQEFNGYPRKVEKSWTARHPQKSLLAAPTSLPLLKSTLFEILKTS